MAADPWVGVWESPATDTPVKITADRLFEKDGGCSFGNAIITELAIVGTTENCTEPDANGKRITITMMGKNRLQLRRSSEPPTEYTRVKGASHL
jgi:hypothetical protein